MADVDDLLAGLRAEGRVDSRGAFTLDRDKALEKMQRFQLADPLYYLLLLVAAAHKRGATAVDFRIDTNDVRVTFDGAPFTRADLEQLFDSLLGRTHDVDHRARRELALALNAALALNPARIRLESGDGQDGVGLTLTTDGANTPHGAAPPVFAFDTPRTPPRDTRIHVRERFAWRAVVEFFQHLAGSLAETRLLAERCRYGDLPVRVNGRDVATGLTLPEARWTATHRRDGLTVLAGFVTPERADAAWPPPRVRWVVDQIFVAEDELDERFLPSLLAIVRCDSLTLDASHAAIVQDDVWSRATEAAAAAQTALLDDLRGSREPGPARGLLLELCLRVAERDVDLFTSPLPFAPSLRAAAVWPGALSGSLLALDALAPSPGAAPSEVRFVIEPFELAPPGVGPTLLLPPRRGAPRLRFGGARLIDVTASYRATARRERRRLEFLARRGQPLVPPGPEVPVVTAFSAGPIHGELGALLGPPGEASVISWYTQDCSLGSERLDLPLPPLHLAVAAPLTPNDDFLLPLPDDALAAAWVAVLGALPTLADAVARHLARELGPTSRGLREWLVALLARLVDPGVAAALSAAVRRPLDAPAPLDRDALLDRGLPLCRAPLFRRVDGSTTSLGALANALANPLEGPSARTDTLSWVDDALPPLVTDGEPNLYAAETELRLLRVAFGADRLRDATDEHRFELNRRAHLAKRLDPPRLVGCTVTVSREGPAGRVLLGVPDDGAWFALAEPDVASSVDVTLHRFDRRLGTLSLPTAAHAPIAAVIDATGLTPTPGWDGVIRDAAFDAFTADLAEALVDLTVVACRELARLDNAPRLRSWLHARLVAVFPSSRLFLAFVTLRAARPDDAADLYDGLLRRALIDPHGANTAIRDAGRRRADEVEALALVARGAPTLEPSQRRLVRDAAGRLQPLTALLDAPLFDRWLGEGRSVVSPFSSVLDEITATGGIDHVPNALADPLLDGPWVILDGPARRAMTRLVGEQRLRAAVARVHDARFRAAFLAEPAQDLRIPDGEALVSVPLDGGDVTGYVGLPVAPSSELNGRYAITAYHLGRHLATRAGEWPHPSVVARLDLPARFVTMNREWTRGTFDDAPLLEALRSALPALFEALRAQWPEHRERPAARAHLLQFLAGNTQRARALGRETDAALRSLPSLPGLDGRWHSVADLLNARVRPDADNPDDGACLYVTTAPAGTEDLPSPSAFSELVARPVLVLDRDTARHLTPLVSRLTEVSQRVATAITSARAQREAPELPPVGALPRLAAARLDAALLRGEVVVPFYDPSTEAPSADLTRVAIGAWGKRVTRVEASALYPTAGTVSVPGGLVTPRFEAVRLGSLQREALESAARRACRDLLARLPSLDAEPRAQALRWLARVARALVVAPTLADADRATLDALKPLPLVDHPIWPSLAEVEQAGHALLDGCDAHLHRARHAARPEVDVGLPPGALGVAFGSVEQATRGWLAVDEATLPWGVDQAIADKPTATLALARELRPLGTLALSLAAGPIRGLVADDRLTPNLTWSGAVDDHALADALAAAKAALLPLTRRVVVAYTGGLTELRGWLLAAFAAGAVDDALADVPLFDLVGRPERLAFAQVLALVDGEGRVPCVLDPPPVADAPSRQLLAIDGVTLAALMRRFGADAIEDAGEWLAAETRRTALMARAQVERVALRAPALVRVTLDRVPARGEVGLSATSADEAHMDCYRERRVVGRVDGFSPFGLLAALDHPELTLTDDHAGVARDGALAHCVAAATSQHEPLVRALAARFGRDADPPLPERDRRVARLHLLRWLARTGDGGGRGGPSARDRSLLDTPALDTADGRRVSFADAIDDSRRHGGLAVLPPGSHPALASGHASRLVVIVESRDLPLHELVVGRTIDYRRGWEDEVAAARNRARLPALQRGDPPEALASTTIRRTDLDGSLSIFQTEETAQARRPGIALGRDSLEVGRYEGPEGLAVWGGLTGAAITVDPRWERASLSSDGQAAVERATIRLYTRLADRYEGSDPLTLDQRESARRVLADAAAGLSERARRAQLPRPLQTLSRRLLGLPLMWTRDGVRLSFSALAAHDHAPADAIRADRRLSARSWQLSPPRLDPEAPLVVDLAGHIGRTGRTGRADAPHLAFDLGRATRPPGAAVTGTGITRVLVRVAASARPRTPLQLTLRYRGEPLGERPLPFPFAPIDVDADGDLFLPDPSWTRTVDGDEGVDTVRREVFARIGPLLVATCRRVGGVQREVDPGAEAAVLSALEAVFPAPTFGRLFTLLWAEHGAEAAADAWLDALEAFAGRPVGALHERLTELLAGAHPVAGIAGAVAARVPPATDPLSDGVVSGLPGERGVRGALLSALLAAPMVPLAHAGRAPRGRPTAVPLARLFAAAASGALVGYVEREIDGPFDEDWLVVDLSETRMKFLVQRALGRAALEDARVWVARRDRERAFLARPARLARLDPSEAVAIRAIRGEGFAGEIGLARPDPGPADEPSTLRPELHLLRSGRLLEVTGLATPVAVLARVDAPGLTPDSAWERAEDDALRQVIVARCRAVAGELVTEVAGRWGALGADEREVAWLHVLDALGAGEAITERLDRGDPEALRLARIPGFVAAEGGARTVADLVEAQRRHGAVYALSVAPAVPAPSEADRRAVVAGRAVRRRMAAIFDKVVDHNQGWVVAAARHRRLHEAPPLPTDPMPPADTLVSLRIDRPGLSGFITLPRAGALEIALAVEGRALGTMALAGPFSAAGWLSGDGIEATDTLGAVWLAAAHLDEVGRAARRAYEQLVRRVERREVAGADLDRARELLRDLLLRLRGARLAALPPPDRRLLRRLGALPLFVVSGGRALALEQVLAARPPELAGLGLWGGGEATTPAERAERLAHLLADELPRVGLVAIPPERIAVAPDRRRKDRIATYQAGELRLLAGHPLAAAALETPDDPVLLVMLASAVATALEEAGQSGHGDRDAQLDLVRRAAQRFAGS